MIFVGQGALLWRAVREARQAGYRIDGVGTDEAPGPADLLEVPRWSTDSLHERAAELAQGCPDGILWSINNSLRFREPLLGSGLRCYNVHNGLLPGQRGLAPVAVLFAVLQGATAYGATLHEIDAQLDTGRILDQERFPVGPAATFQDVMLRGLQACHQLYVRNLPRVAAGDLTARAAADTASEYYGSRRLQELGPFVGHPNYARATHLGIFAGQFPQLEAAIARAGAEA